MNDHIRKAMKDHIRKAINDHIRKALLKCKAGSQDKWHCYTRNRDTLVQ